MSRTIYESPILYGALRRVSALWLRWAGWRVEGELPPFGKFVVIAAPHTSNWDFPLMMAIAANFGTGFFWLGKHTLFVGWAGRLMRWLGGIAVNRADAGGVVPTLVDAFARHDKLIVAIPPEGTRGKVRKWKSGFHRVARGAGVPVVLAYLDYKRKVGGIGPIIHPSDDYQADLEEIKTFYADVTGKYPDRFA